MRTTANGWLVVATAVSIGAIALGGCGGGGSEATADAAPPVILTHTAHGVHDGVLERVEEVLGGEVSLLKIVGERLDAGGEAPPADVQSYWQLQFVNPTTSQILYVLYAGGNVDVGTPEAFEGDPSLLISLAWRDSSEALAKLPEAGFTAPLGGPPEYLLAMELEQFVGAADDPRSAVPEPFWTVDKIHDPVDGPPEGEQWQIAFVSGMNSWLACDLTTFTCGTLDP